MFFAPKLGRNCTPGVRFDANLGGAQSTSTSGCFACSFDSLSPVPGNLVSIGSVTVPLLDESFELKQ